MAPLEALGGSLEVVPMQTVDLVGPPGYRDTPPLGEEGGMVALRLGEGADPVGEGQRVGEAREVETRSSWAIPSRSSSCQPEISRLSSAISASVTRGESRRQATHRSADSVLIARTSGFLRAGKLRSPDALFGDLHALDTLEAEEQFDE